MRLLYFPRPFPDEMVGGLVLRAAQHYGLSLKSMNALLHGRRRTYTSLGLASGLPRIAAAAGMCEEELLWEHTVLPFVTAFMSDADTRRLAASLLQPNAVRNSALTQPATLGTLRARHCALCAIDDERVYGEPYWRRHHNVTFAYKCHAHDVPLLDTGPGGTLKHATQALPLRVGAGDRLTAPLNPYALHLLCDEISSALGARNRREPSDWHASYRTTAMRQYTCRRGGDLASKGIAMAFRSYFGAPFLASHGLDFEPDHKAWPALMLRTAQSIPYTTPKHILLRVFLDQAPTVLEEPIYRPPGRTTRDYAKLDEELAERLRQMIGVVKQEGKRVEVKALLASIGALGMYRHNRFRLPKTAELLDAFRCSELSARQVGKRPRKY